MSTGYWMSIVRIFRGLLASIVCCALFGCEDLDLNQNIFGGRWLCCLVTGSQGDCQYKYSRK